MSSRGARKLILPLAAFLAAVLLLAAALAAVTARDLRLARLRLENELFEKGLTLIRTVEAGARTGMTATMYGREFMARLLAEASLEPDVEYIRLLDKDGNLIAGGEENPAPGPWRLPDGLAGGGPRRQILPGRIPHMVIYKRFAPSSPPGQRGRRRMMMGQNENCFMMAPGVPAPDESYVVVSLSMRLVRIAQSQALRRASLSGLILLLAGVGGIAFFGLAQRQAALQKRLAAASSYADRVVAGMADGLIAVDTTGAVTVTNEALAKIIPGIGPAQIGLNIDRAVPELADEVHRALNKGEETVERSLAVIRHGRPVRLSARVSPLRDGDEISGAVLLLRDVGEVEALRRKLREGEKLAALGGMAAAVAHEVRNPLSSIRGLSQLLAGKFGAGAPEKKYVDVILDEVGRLNRFVEDLLVFVSPSAPRRKLTDAAAVIGDTADLYREEGVSRNIHLEIQVPADLPPVDMDADLFRRALANIIRNAYDAAGDKGGEVRLTASRSADGGIIITVRDTGPGLPEGFSMEGSGSFYSTKPGGTGLGLSIIRQVVEKHGWTFDLVNVTGGAEASIVIPSRDVK